jgi:hypothetical protein
MRISKSWLAAVIIAAGVMIPVSSIGQKWQVSTPETIPGMATPKAYYADSANCDIYTDRVVLTTVHGAGKDDLHYSFTVMRRGPIDQVDTACQRDASRILFALNDLSASQLGLDINSMDVLALWRQFLFISQNYIGDDQLKRLVVYDISQPPSSNPVYSRDLVSAVSLQNDDTLIFYSPDDQNPEAKKCTPAPGLRPGFNAKVALNLKTLKPRILGGKCVNRQ